MSTPTTTRPTPVLDAQKITAAVLGVFGAVVTFLAAFGVIVNGNSEQTVVSVLTGIGTLAGIVLPIVQAKSSAQKVTPTADPQTDDGTALVPATVDLSGPVVTDQPGS